MTSCKSDLAGSLSRVVTSAASQNDAYKYRQQHCRFKADQKKKLYPRIFCILYGFLKAYNSILKKKNNHLENAIYAWVAIHNM